jgi:hypothetical protein
MKTYKVFCIYDSEWWAGESIEDCIAECRKVFDKDSYDGALDDYHELSESEIADKQFQDEGDGSVTTLLQILEHALANGEQLPLQIAASDW